MLKKKVLLPTIAAALLLAGAWILRSHFFHPEEEFKAWGNVDTREVALAFEASGRIARLGPEEGEAVQAGDEIGRLDTESLRISLREAEANLAALTAEQSLKREGYRVWVGGFSTGGNIAIALADEIEVEGVVLFSPAPYVRTNLVYLVPAASLFFEWLRSPEETGGGTTPVRYRTIPMTGLSAFYDTMRAAQSALAHPSPTLRRAPVFLALAESDSIVDALRVLDAADGAFRRRGSDVLWYGEAAPQTARLPLFRLESRLPKEHVRSFSHLSLNFSPENDYYGRQGRLKRCAGAEAAARSPYLHCGTPEAEVTYGAWGEKRGEGVFVRLTFNPYFRLQTERLIDFFSH